MLLATRLPQLLRRPAAAVLPGSALVAATPQNYLAPSLLPRRSLGLLSPSFTHAAASAGAAVSAAAAAATTTAAAAAAASGKRLLSTQQAVTPNRQVLKNVPKSKRFELAVTPGNMPNATLKSYKPTSPSLRHRVIIDKSHLWPGRPVKSLTWPIKGHGLGGRNNRGRITVRGRMGRKHRQIYREVDFRRRQTGPAVVQRFEYDPNRSAFIALIKYEANDRLSYILAPRDLAVGMTVRCGPDAPFAPGNAMELGLLPEGAEVHNIEVLPGHGGKLVRSAGMSAQLMSKDDRYVTLKFPSGEIRKILRKCNATIGVVSNGEWHNRVLGKAGASAWEGRRPKVRGVAMNPVDHPMGGGEGKTSGGRPSVSPWGWYTKGLRTRNKKQHSSKLIMRRRNHDKLGLSNIRNSRNPSW